MLETTRALLATAARDPGERVAEGMAPILFPPNTRLLLAGRPRRRLIDHLRPFLDGSANSDGQVPDPPNVLIIASGRAWRRGLAAAQLGTRILIDSGRRRPVVGANDLIIELRGERMIEAKAGDAPPSGPALPVGWWRTKRAIRLVAWVARRRLQPERATRWAILHVVEGDAREVPDAIRSALDSAGYSVAGYRTSVRDRRNHYTQKVLVDLQSPTRESDLIVKLVRDPADGERIDNEVLALRRLAALSSAAQRAPQVVAAGRLRDRPFVAQSRVEGEPLSALLDQRDQRTDQALRSVIDWTIEIGRQTRQEAHADEPAVLMELVNRFVRWPVPAHIAARLSADAERIARSIPALPLVLMHGDLGTWNILVDRQVRVSVLDWEACEPRGVPLWDLFYFARNAAVSPSAEQPGRAVQTRLLEDDTWRVRLQRAVHASVDATGTPPDLVPALFRLCWVHRALKEARRLGGVDTSRGYAQLVVHMATLSDEKLKASLLGESRRP